MHSHRPCPALATIVLATGTIVLAALVPGPARAERDVDGIEELLPHHETREEIAWRSARGARRRLGGDPATRVAADPPPASPIRGCAEWEPMTGVLVRFPLGLPYALLRDMDDQVTLHVIVTNSLLATAQANLAANGVDMDRVEFLVEPNNSIWVRDYGPWFVFDGAGRLVIVDHVYNRPSRPADDLIPVRFGAQQGIPVVRHDMWHTGGNYMTDGEHIASSTDLVYTEAAYANGMTPAEVDQLMADYYGIAVYAVVEDIEAGGIHHIDTWGKFLDEETVLVKEVWPSHHTYDDLEQRATLLASLDSSTGRPYRVMRVYCHDIGSGRPASYTNSLILNDQIYVPTFGSPAEDAAALMAYQSAAPGYGVRGYDHTGWLTDDALHCRAKGVADRGMLRVAHVPIVAPAGGDVPIEATVVAHAGAAVTSVELVHRQGGDPWEDVAMVPIGDDRYRATIPAPAVVTTTEYYLHAEDASGRSEGMPRTEPAAWYAFTHAPTGVAVGDATGADDRTAEALVESPFLRSTRISFQLRRADRVTVTVVDVRGRVVRRLADETMAAGRREVRWDGRDRADRPVAPGVYRILVRTAGIVYAKTVVKLE